MHAHTRTHVRISMQLPRHNTILSSGVNVSEVLGLKQWSQWVFLIAEAREMKSSAVARLESFISPVLGIFLWAWWEKWWYSVRLLILLISGILRGHCWTSPSNQNRIYLSKPWNASTLEGVPKTNLLWEGKGKFRRLAMWSDQWRTI